MPEVTSKRKKTMTTTRRKPFLCKIGIHTSLCHQSGYASFWFCNHCGTEVPHA